VFQVGKALRYNSSCSDGFNLTVFPGGQGTRSKSLASYVYGYAVAG
jgi:hypothetical protein